MLAAYVAEHGGPEVVALRELPEPVPGPDDVIVAPDYSAINFPDLLIIANRYQVSVPVPFVPGSEFAGRIVRVGANVDARRVGELVFGATMNGAFAERVRVPADGVSPLPRGLNTREGAVFGVSYRTAYSALRRAGEVTPGEWVVVLGASGAVGTATIDVALALGASVVAVASTDQKLAVCASRGATGLVRSGEGSVRDAIREVTGEGADVVIDLVGGPLAEQSLRALRYGGRFVTVGYASGEIPRIALNLLLVKGVQARGYDIRLHGERAPEEVAVDRAALDQLVEEHAIRPHIGGEYALHELGDGLAAVGSRRTTGKIVIRMPAADAAH